MPRSRGRTGPPTATSYGGRLVFYTDRGRLIVRKWPKKRGPSKSPKVREQNDWFRAVTKLIKRAPASQVRVAMDITKNTGLYPRDLLMTAVSEGIANPVFPNGGGLVSRRPRATEMAWEGARLQRTATFNVPANTITTMPWQTPIIDTSAFWNVADPNFIVIPTGPFLCEFTAGVNTNSLASGRGVMFLQSSRTGLLARSDIDSISNQSNTLLSGPILVLPGDKIRLDVYFEFAVILSPNQATYLATTTLLVIGDLSPP